MPASSSRPLSSNRTVRSPRPSAPVTLPMSLSERPSPRTMKKISPSTISRPRNATESIVNVRRPIMSDIRDTGKKTQK